jgi:MFS family permease
MTDQTAPSMPARGAGMASERYPWYVVCVLMLAAILSFVDRQILSLLVEPIKRDLQITDLQISLLQGLAFSIFYAICGIPIGRLVDSFNRRNIILIGGAVWTMATAVCGLANSYLHLFLARMAVGVGEAALGPAAYSMISDYFARHRVPLALGVYSVGVSVGAGLAFVIGGLAAGFAAKGDVTLPLVGVVHGWQAAFIIVGLPGLLIAPLMLTVREPARRNRLAGAAAVPLSAVAAFLRQHSRLSWSYVLGISLFTALSYGSLSWVPSYFIRVHGWTAKETGAAVGAMILVLSTIGIFGGGWVASWLARRGRSDATFRTALWAAALSVPFSVAAPLMPTPGLSMLFFGPAFVFGSAYVSLGPSTIQMVTPNQMRGQVSAISLMLTNLLGGVLGPAMVAFATDRIFGNPAAVGQSLALVAAVLGPLAVCTVAWGLAPLRRAEEAARTWEAAQS